MHAKDLGGYTLKVFHRGYVLYAIYSPPDHPGDWVVSRPTTGEVYVGRHLDRTVELATRSIPRLVCEIPENAVLIEGPEANTIARLVFGHTQRSKHVVALFIVIHKARITKAWGIVKPNQRVSYSLSTETVELR